MGFRNTVGPTSGDYLPHPSNKKGRRLAGLLVYLVKMCVDVQDAAHRLSKESLLAILR